MLDLNTADFSFNEVFQFGGAIFSTNLTSLTFSALSFTKNSGAVGGAAFLRGTYLWDLHPNSSILFDGNSALLGSAMALSDLKDSFALHDIVLKDNVALQGGTVFWIKDPEKNNVPPGLNSTTLQWQNNIAAYGEKSATQAVSLHVSPVYNVTVYNSYLQPTVMAQILDYYNQLIVSSNTTRVSTEVGPSHCFERTAYTDGETSVFTVNGVAQLTSVKAYCYPLGNISMVFTAIVKEVGVLGLMELDSYNPVATSSFQFRDCVAGERIKDGACVECERGTYQLTYNKDTMCHNCNEFADLCYGNQIYVKSGYWRRLPLSTAIIPCPDKGEGCVGGNSTGDGLCAKGYQGPLCSMCTAKYFKKSGTLTCVECSGTNIFTPAVILSLIILIIVLFLLSIFVYGQLKRYISETPVVASAEEIARKEKLTYWNERFTILRDRFKILMSTFQIACSAGGSLKVNFPPSFDNFLRSFRIFNFSLIEVMPLSCVYSNDYVSEVIIATTIPAAAAMCIFIVFVAELYLYRKGFLKTTESDLEIYRRLKLRYCALFLLLTYLILPSTTTSIFNMFLCENIDPLGEDDLEDLYLRADYSLSCRSSRYNFGVAWAICMIFVYPIGIQACYAHLLYKRRHYIIDPDTMKDDENQQRKVAMVEFLYRSYRPECWYFELIETCRRLLLTAVLSTIAPGLMYYVYFVVK